MLELVRWIEADPAADIRLPALARHAGMSKYHLVRVFRQVVGLPPHAFIRRARLRNATLDIAATDRPILDVALSAGFSDVSTFNAAFKKQFGHSPRSVRQRVGAHRQYGDLSALEAAATSSAALPGS